MPRAELFKKIKALVDKRAQLKYDCPMETKTCAKYPRLKVTKCGKVFGPQHELAVNLNYKGYSTVRDLLPGDKCRIVKVHRLVALCWLDKPEGKDQVNHKDGNKGNNHVDNLEWCTLQENIEHARVNGLLVRNRSK